jgi:hypothetical protein
MDCVAVQEVCLAIDPSGQLGCCLSGISTLMRSLCLVDTIAAITANLIIVTCGCIRIGGLLCVIHANMKGKSECQKLIEAGIYPRDALKRHNVLQQ